MVILMSVPAACRASEFSPRDTQDKACAGPSLFQGGTRLLRHSEMVGSLNVFTDHAGSTCAPLANKGSHFTVDIEVGTPGQKFSVVADTGSDSVIVPSCVCQEKGACDENDRCFRGTNKSSTFSLRGLNASQLKVQQPKSLPVVQMVFGSGAVRAIVATDVVKVGALKANMQDGLLLMVDHQLRMIGAFEGILGLGQPKNETLLKEMQKKMEEDMAKQVGDVNSTHRVQAKGSGANSAAAMEAIKRMMRAIMGGGGGGGGGQEPPAAAVAHSPKPGFEASLASSQLQRPIQFPNPEEEAQGDPAEEDPTKEVEQFKTKSFLQSSGITRFSMCFNDKGQEGALHLGIPNMNNALTSVGVVHWGLALQGISIGKGQKSLPVKICNPDSKKEGQKYACGAIPDSGTTLFMGPADHMEKVFEGLCDGWKRCRDATSNGLAKKKGQVFMLLLSQCSEWLTEEHGLNELPSLHLQLGGANGKKKKLSFGGAAYVLETMEDDVQPVWKNIMGMKLQVPEKTGNKTKMCRPAFGAMQLDTKTHGPIWILGSPVFYEYSVGYDLDKSKPAISFMDTKTKPCGCSAEAALMSKANQTKKHMARQPRLLHGPPRMPTIDLSLGL